MHSAMAWSTSASQHGTHRAVALTASYVVQIVRPQFAAAFCNGMEYFNTYGGCTAAGAAGMATLRVIQEENFQARAARVGLYLTAKLNHLKEVCCTRGPSTSLQFCLFQASNHCFSPDPGRRAELP